MELWDRLLVLLRMLRGTGRRTFELDERLYTLLVKRADQEGRLPEAVQAELIEAGLAQQQKNNKMAQRWQSLSAREQQVTALTCLGYTNGQISVRLNISIETVKTHIRNILVKFNLFGKGEIKRALEEWDFSEWYWKNELARF
jgi:DNA-binding CsgD family transcriptional regulator